MPIFDYKCEKCGFTDEYIKSISVPKDMQPPETCPKCGGKMDKIDSFGKLGFDLRGAGFYTNDYGKHAWQKNLSVAQQAAVLTGDKNPY